MEVEKKTTPAKLAAEIRIFLKRGGSEDRARGVQRFFKEEIQSRGWRTADLRRVSLRLRREILRQYGLTFCSTLQIVSSPGPSTKKKTSRYFCWRT